MSGDQHSLTVKHFLRCTRCLSINLEDFLPHHWSLMLLFDCWLAALISTSWIRAVNNTQTTDKQHIWLMRWRVYLVLIRPEGADSQFHLMPLFSMRPRGVPNWTPQWATVDPHVRLQSPGTVAISAVQEVAELDAVGVVFTQRLKQ